MEAEKKYDPIVFMNTPISDDGNDVIGINSTVDAIKCATDKGAKLIGIIAEYGSGKSSLTEILSTDKEKFGKAIKINLWDSLSKDSLLKESSQTAINLLTKSFLFQLASGISDYTAKHVNRRLSKNYGIISLSISSWCFWLWATLAGVAYILFKVTSTISIEVLNDLIKSITPNIMQSNLQWWVSIIKYSSPVFLVVGIIFLLIGFRNTVVAFSHWKAQNTREPEVNDVFESYIDIYKNLLSRKKRRLIIIEDLDRIDNRSLVVGFLKEIYRFNNLAQTPCRKKSPIFVISVKPESLLSDNDNKIEELAKLEADEVYSKLFDYTVSLKPIHYVDYGDIVLNIIGGERSKNQILLQNLLEEKDKIQNSRLPESFSWIIEGHNLTIRELKNRLNCAVALLVTLKNKGYTNQSYINFSSCAAVAYLELRYPYLYSELIKQEDIFSKLVQDSYSIRNSENAQDRKQGMSDIVNQYFGLMKLETDIADSDEIHSIKVDIIRMLLAGDISEDFRMYFYSFPKGSYIKNGDERQISDLLLFPNDYPVDDQLDEKMKRINESGKEKTVTDILNQIGYNTQQEFYPSIIIQNEFMFKVAYEVNSKKADATVRNLTSWENNKRKNSQDILVKLFSYSFDSIDTFWKDYDSWMLSIMDEFDEESVIDIRKRIINVFGDKVIIFKDLFLGQTVNSRMPIITEAELYAVSSMIVGITLINVGLINENNIAYIAMYINHLKLDSVGYRIAHEVYSFAITTISATSLWRSLIAFLKINEAVDNEFFSFSLSAISQNETDKKIIAEYVNGLTINNISDAYCKSLDEAIIDIDLSDGIVQLLYESGRFIALLSLLVKTNRVNFVDLTMEENADGIILACGKLVVYDMTLIPQIRNNIIRQFKDKDMLETLPETFDDLYYGEYPLITRGEIDEIDSVPFLLKHLNRELIDSSNYIDVVSFINSKAQGEDCLDNIRYLFSDEYGDIYQDITAVRNIIDSLDYEKIGFSELTCEDKEKAIKHLTIYLDLTNPEIASNFMVQSRSLIPSLEKIVFESGNPSLYVSIINQIDTPTEYTIDWVINNEISFALAPNLLKSLLERKQESKYLIGKVLADENFEFPYPGVSNEIVYSHYRTTSPIWFYIKDNHNLINYIIQSKKYVTLNESEFPDVLRPLYNGKQTIEFLKFLFSKASEQEKINYLGQMGEILNAENSIEISSYLSVEPNISLLKDNKLFYMVRERLWEEVPKNFGYKGVFTRKRNRWIQNNRTISTKLKDLGFTDHIKSQALCEYKDDANNLSVTINIPEWGNRPDESDNGCVTFSKVVNDYSLGIRYYPNEQRFTLTSDKGGTSAKYEYFENTGEFGGEYPDHDTVTAQFEAMYNDINVQDVLMKGINLFQEYVNGTFGMSINQLYSSTMDK